MNYSDSDKLIIILFSIAGISLLCFFYLLIRVRFLIKKTLRNMNEITYKLNFIEKTKRSIPNAEKISKKLKEISEGLKKLNDSIKRIRKL